MYKTQSSLSKGLIRDCIAPTIRLANQNDAENLSTLAEKTFRDAFSEFNSAENMDLFCQQHYSANIQAKEIVNPDIVTIVAEENGELVAYAQLRWDNRPDCISAQCEESEVAGEIQRIYVDKSFHGNGLAHQLIQEWRRQWIKNNRYTRSIASNYRS